MSVPALYAPWRMDYIKSLGKAEKDGKCFLCQAAAATDTDQRRDRLVLWQTPFTVVLLNRYPYANGHLLVAPLQHLADLEELSPDLMQDLLLQTTRAVKLLRNAVSAQGFNIGINLGRVAGAGVPGHLHQHIVPRWGGDTNFMHAIGEVSVVPQANSQLYAELIRVMADMGHSIPTVTGRGRFSDSVFGGSNQKPKALLHDFFLRFIRSSILAF